MPKMPPSISEMTILAGDLSRSPEARALAEEALARLLAQLGERAGDVVVIGGLTPPTLAVGAETPHQGTVDIDLVLEVGFSWNRDDEYDFGWLERGVIAAGFTTMSDNIGWRWKTVVDGFTVKLEILCDVTDNPDQEIALPGASSLTAKNLEGPGVALADTVERSIVRGSGLVARFTGLGGYVLAKVAAVVHRGEIRDLYDLAYVLLYNDEGGPVEAAEAARAIPAVDGRHRANVRALRSIYAHESSDGPVAFAADMVGMGDVTDPETLRQDAVSAVATFADTFLADRD